MRQLGVPPRNPSAVAAAGFVESIFARRLLNSATVRSLVQHFGLEPGPDQGTLHLAFRGVATMSVVVWRSHSECRHTSSPSAVKVVSHSTIPAPILAPAL